MTRRLVLRPRTGWQPLELREIWNYRDLFWMFATRDIKVRYRQTVLGIAWAVVQPLATMVIFTMISRFGNIPTDGVPAPLFYYAGMLPWFLFSNSVTAAGNSLLGSQHLISKVYFPRLVVPIAAVVTSLVDFLIGFVLLLAMMAWYGVHPGLQILLLPLVVALAFLTALAFGVWLCALTVQFRDVRHVMPFAIQFWLFCTPVLYPSSVVHSPWKRALLVINPVSGIVDAVRWCVFGGPAPGSGLLVASGVIALAMMGSLYYFRSFERTLVDRL